MFSLSYYTDVDDSMYPVHLSSTSSVVWLLDKILNRVILDYEVTSYVTKAENSSNCQYPLCRYNAIW